MNGVQAQMSMLCYNLTARALRQEYEGWSHMHTCPPPLSPSLALFVCVEAVSSLLGTCNTLPLNLCYQWQLWGIQVQLSSSMCFQFDFQ